MKWFRFYTEVLDDPKVQRLDPVTFKQWINLLCVAAKNDGKFPANEDLAFALRMDVIAIESLLDRLLIAGLIDVVKGGQNGKHIAPHGWSKRQYKSDTSTERVKRYRERSNSVTETPPDTDTETEVSVAKATGASAPDADKVFWSSAKDFLTSGGVGKPGPLIGKWCRDHGQPETARAITAAQIERAVEPVAYIERVLRGAAGRSDVPMC